MRLASNHKQYDKDSADSQALKARREDQINNSSTRTCLPPVGRRSLLTHEQEIALAKRIRSGDLKAKQQLVESNLGLVISIAKKHDFRAIPFEDLVQEGVIGLMKAATKFDPTKGFKFSTYATHWVKQTISRAIANQSRTIRVPNYLAAALRKMEHVRSTLESELGRPPTNEELAKETGVSVRRLLDLQKVASEPVSLESLVSADAETPLVQLLPDLNVEDPEECMLASATREASERLLDCLEERERQVIAKRFGFEGGRARSLQQIGGEMNLSRERVRQIELKALKKLRDAARGSQLAKQVK